MKPPDGIAPEHPRLTPDLVGHETAEQVLLDATAAGRLPHAWLIGGPRGVGKATLAFRFARFLLSQGGGAGDGSSLFDAPPAILHVDPESALFRRVASGGHADLLYLERSVNDKTGRLRSDIGVDEARRIPDFFALTPAEGGWRVCIVDSVDEMNRNAANALLKIVEEPPPRSVILLIAHAPGAVLTTLRSRCRRLILRPLPDAAVIDVIGRRMPEVPEAERPALARLAEGSPGRALSLGRLGGLQVLEELFVLLRRLPEVEPAALHALADRLARREAEAAYQAFTDLLGWWLARLVHHAASGTVPMEVAAGEADLMRRLTARRSLDQWVEVWEKVGGLVERTDSLNLDRKQVVLTAFSALSRAARG